MTSLFLDNPYIFVAPKVSSTENSPEIIPFLIGLIMTKIKRDISKAIRAAHRNKTLYRDLGTRVAPKGKSKDPKKIRRKWKNKGEY